MRRRGIARGPQSKRSQFESTAELMRPEYGYRSRKRKRRTGFEGSFGRSSPRFPTLALPLGALNWALQTRVQAVDPNLSCEGEPEAAAPVRSYRSIRLRRPPRPLLFRIPDRIPLRNFCAFASLRLHFHNFFKLVVGHETSA